MNKYFYVVNVLLLHKNAFRTFLFFFQNDRVLIAGNVKKICERYFPTNLEKSIIHKNRSFNEFEINIVILSICTTSMKRRFFIRRSLHVGDVINILFCVKNRL